MTTAFDNFDGCVATTPTGVLGSQTTTTMQDSSQSWIVNSFQTGIYTYYVTITGGTGAGQQRLITGNSSNTLTVSTAWATQPVSGTSTYSINQVPICWGNPNSQSVKLAAISSGYVGSPNGLGYLGPLSASGLNLLGIIRNGSVPITNGCQQFSQIVNYTSGNFGFMVPIMKAGSQSNGLMAYTDFSAPGTNVTIFAIQSVFINGPTYNIGKTFLSGSTVITKCETVDTVNGNGTPQTTIKVKYWASGSAEPVNWDVTYNDFGVGASSSANTWGSGPVFTLSGSGSGTTAIYGNVVGGIIIAGLISPTGQGAVYASAPTITISGGGGSGATATCTIDAFGHIASITITGGGTGYTNTPTIAFTGGNTNGIIATAILATNSSGFISAMRITQRGTLYSSKPTATVTGTGTGQDIRFLWDSVSQSIGPFTSATYRGVNTIVNGTPPAPPVIDNYYEGDIGTIFGIGVSIPVNFTGIFYSPGNWFINGTNKAITNNNGAYVKFSFTGTSISISVDQKNTTQAIRYSVDNGAWQNYNLLFGQNILPLASGLSAGTHQVIIYANGNNAANDRWNTPIEALNIVAYLVDASSSVASPGLIYPNTIFFMGDSIVEGISAGGSNITDSQANWVSPVAHALMAEYGQIGYGGAGFTSGGAGNVPAFSTNYQYFFLNQSRMSGLLFAIQPNHIVCEHGVNGNWTSFDAVVAWSNLRAAAPSANIFQLIPFSGPGHLFNGTKLSGIVSSSTSLSLTDSRASFTSVYGVCANMVLVAISPSKTIQVKTVTPLGNTNTTLNITNAWTTQPDATYTYMVMTAYEYYTWANPSDLKYFMINLGTDISIGLTGSGPATQQSYDNLHPLATYASHLATQIYSAILAKLNPVQPSSGSMSF
jgi:hypothetical protein